MKPMVEVTVVKLDGTEVRVLRTVESVDVTTGLLTVSHTTQEHLEYTMGSRLPTVIQLPW